MGRCSKPSGPPNGHRTGEQDPGSQSLVPLRQSRRPSGATCRVGGHRRHDVHWSASRLVVWPWAGDPDQPDRCRHHPAGDHPAGDGKLGASVHRGGRSELQRAGRFRPDGGYRHSDGLCRAQCGRQFRFRHGERGDGSGCTDHRAQRPDLRSGNRQYHGRSGGRGGLPSRGGPQAISAARSRRRSYDWPMPSALARSTPWLPAWPSGPMRPGKSTTSWPTAWVH